MTQKGLPKRLWPVRLATQLSTILYIAGCASAPPPAPVRDVQAEDRYLLLQQKMRDKESEIERLSAAVEILKAKSEMARHETSPTAKIERNLPRVKLSPKTPVEKEEPEDLTADEAVSLADSRHESMHWYQRGLTLIEKGQYEAAIDAFQAFLKASPRHLYSDRAQYWIGEAHFRAQEFPLAVIAMNRLEHEFPDSFRYVEASWKKSLALEQMGRADEAVGHLKELIRKFPQHPLSDQASHKLASLEVGLAKAKP